MEVVCLYRKLTFVAACLAIVYLQIIMHACFILVLIYLAIVFSWYLWQQQIWIGLLLIVILYYIIRNKIKGQPCWRHGESWRWWIWRDASRSDPSATSCGSSPVLHLECGPVGSSLDLVEFELSSQMGLESLTEQGIPDQLCKSVSGWTEAQEAGRPGCSGANNDDPKKQNSREMVMKCKRRFSIFVSRSTPTVHQIRAELFGTSTAD